MLLLSIFLLSIASTMGRSVTTKKYELTIENNNLQHIRIIGPLPEVLDLSNLDIETIDGNVFRDLNHLKTLNLSKNAISSLPKSIFSNLGNLEHLDLAENLLETGYFYSGLNSLETLNISRNPEGGFRAGHFFGLPKTVTIIVNKKDIRAIGAGMFEDPSSIIKPASINTVNEIEKLNNPILANVDTKIEVQICLEGSNLASVTELKSGTAPDNNCGKREVTSGNLRLTGLDIETFSDYWYQVENNDVKFLDLGSNKITRITSQLLNDLPASVTSISFRGNQIERLEKDVMSSQNQLELLDLGLNIINTIEIGALANLKIDSLLLDGNQLSDTQFIDSLESSIQELSLRNNKISVLSSINIWKFTKITNLDLSSNNLAEAHYVQGLQSLEELKLSHNLFTTINAGYCQDLKQLRILELGHNKIASLEAGAFYGLEKIESIDLSFNELTEIKGGLFIGLPKSLKSLNLANNRIKSLKTSTFVNVPTTNLNLADNEISTIEKETFHLEDLEELDLSRNPIESLKDGVLAGLSKQKDTLVSLWNVPVQVVEGGVFEYMHRLG